MRPLTPFAPENSVTRRWLSPRLFEVDLSCAALGAHGDGRVRILVPPDAERRGVTFPVVYLLHGAGDTFESWTTVNDGYPTSLEAFTEDKPVIVVMPDGGRNQTAGWYTDWHGEGSPSWETFHLRRVIPYVESSLPARIDRQGRVVAGLSMGGYGAMSYAARHPDLFAGAFSFSGALDVTDLHRDQRVWGLDATHDVRRGGRNPVDLAANLADVRVWFRIGTGLAGGPGPLDGEHDRLEALLLPTNERFARALDAAGVAYTFETVPVGGHNWYHWHDGFARAWPEMEAVFETRSTDPPTTFSFLSTDLSFEVWGWSFATHRHESDDQLRLQNVSTGGLTLVGHGRVDITTPGVYRPSARYDLLVDGPVRDTTSSTLEVRSDGTLSFSVVLSANGPTEARIS